MRWPAYPKYKDSGADWLGEVPEGWSVFKLKEYLARNDGGVWGNDPLSEEDTIVLRSTEQGIDGDWIINEPARRNLTSSEISKTLLLEGDLLVTKSSGSELHIGKTSLVTADIAKMQPCYSNFMQRLRLTEDMSPRLVHYYFNNIIIREQFIFLSNSTTGLANLSSATFRDLVLCFPDYCTQLLIVRFLDQECKKINSLIAEQEKLIALFQEKRQAVISHAVTKGLNPDAPMKDSGVEWLGSVPKHWRILPLKRCLREPLKYGANEAAELLDPNLPRYIRITDLRDDGTLNPDTFCSLPYEVAESYLLADGDVLLARSGATVGKSFIFRESMGCAAYAGYLIKASTTKLLVPDFLYLFSQSFGYWQWVNSIFIKSTIQNISAEKYGSLVLPVPPRAEQMQIVKFVEKTAKDIDSLMEMTSNSMALLRERRTALISAAVTGKIDVRGLTASEPA